MITLLIKKKWFDMIRTGEKKEEYRDIKPYYITRFLKEMRFPKSWRKNQNDIKWFLAELEQIAPNFYTDITIQFRNGYHKDAPTLLCKCRLRVGYGKPEWGAEPEVKYFILDIIEIL